MKEKFDVWSYFDDTELDRQFPAPSSSTTREFLKEAEPDKRTLGLSVGKAEAKGFTNGITLRERLLFELAYFNETGNHLDIKGVTFCSGSRYADGDVPNVHWYSGRERVRVYWYSLGNSRERYGLRSAVCLNPSSSFPLDIEDAIKTVKDAGYVIYKPI